MPAFQLPNIMNTFASNKFRDRLAVALEVLEAFSKAELVKSASKCIYKTAIEQKHFSEKHSEIGDDSSWSLG